MSHHQASHATNLKPEEEEAKHYAVLEGVDKWFVAHPHKNFQGQPEKGVEPEETTASDVLRTMSERLGVAAAGFGGSRRAVDELVA